MNTDNLSATARICIRKSPTVVFDAFIDAREMSRFWFTRHDDCLKEGESVSWFLGNGPDAISFDVRVKELRAPDKLVLEWVGNDGKPTQVTWSLEETADGDTILAIEETGFAGSEDVILGRIMDSTRGFNQVIIAAKALIEHGVEINVVADHG